MTQVSQGMLGRALAFMFLAALTLGGTQAEVLTVKLAGGNGFATLQPDITYTEIANGFARATLKFDVIKPAADKPTPVIVFVPGNGWQSVDRSALIPELAPFARAGYLVATIDYRIIGEARFPEPLKDVKTAIRFLRANAQKYNIDPSHIGIWGNSAGGQLSAMAAMTGDNKEFENDKWPGVSSAVQAAVLWYAPNDLSDLPGDPRFVENAHLGLDVRDPANMDRVKKANPISYITANAPAVLLVHGTADPLVPIRHSRRFYEALVAAHVPATLIEVEGAGHSFGQVSSQPEVMAAVLAFFDQNLKPHLH